MKRHKTIDAYIEAATHWQDELIALRKILNSTPLEETVKWGGPCYTWEGKNLVGLGAYKSFVSLWFFQGALLSDSDKVLINAQEGKTKAMRQWRITSKKDIRPARIKAYVSEAIELQKSGKEIKPERAKRVVVPKELKAALNSDQSVSNAFNALTRSQRREYADYVSSAKREDTKARRIDKIMPMIAAGKGLNDRYRNC